MKKPTKQTIFWGDAGKLLLDLGKLVVGGVIIGSILRGGISPAILIICGSVIAFILFILGLFWITKEKRENKE